MTQKFPVVVWQDAQGAYTASVLDGAKAAAYDTSIKSALLQLKRYLAWDMRKPDSEVGTPDFDDLSLRDHRVRVRGEYKTDEYVYPVSQPTDLCITVVHGTKRDGSRHCVIPTLGIRLSYQPTDPIDNLVAEAIQQGLGKMTPQELSRQLMPGPMSLHAVYLRQRDPARRDDLSRIAALSSVAERLGQRGRGARWSRALLRHAEVARTSQHLLKDRASLLLVGESGVGKTTVLAEAIRQMQRHLSKPRKDQTEEERKQLAASRNFWLTSGARLIAGMKYLGQWEERVERVIAELGETGGILCIEDLLELATAGGQSAGAGIAAFLQPYVERGELRIVAETTPAELDACRQLLPALVDLFQIIRIPEFSAADGRAVLDELLKDGAKNRKLELAEGLAGLIYRLYKRFQPYAAFPGRSASFVRHLIDDVARAQRKKVTSTDVLDRFQRETGLPEVLLRDDLPLPHEEVLRHFNREVLGQEAACSAAAGVVTALKSGLNDPNRPLGVLLFCGPTGVGKTELAKALARFMFGAGSKGGSANDRLVRLDMSEYAGYGAASRLFQNADGQLSEFIQRIRRQPFVVVLFDEIEKAAPEVHDALLGVLDEGRLTDRFGRTTTFRSAVIVMTSNVGAERGSALGFDASAEPAFERVAMQTFRPEFYNRIDSVITFRSLSREIILSLARRELSLIPEREGLAKRNLRLEWSDAVVEHLASAGYDARYGARPLHRAVEKLVIAPLARWLLAHPATREQTVHLELTAEGELEVW